MKQNEIGIWVDHTRAVIVSAAGGQVTARTVASGVAGHPRYGGQQDGGGEKKYEERHRQDLNRYYDDLIGQLGHPAALLILGPGEAKGELKTRLAGVAALAACPIAVEAADALTDAQIVAKVQTHFARRL